MSPFAFHLVLGFFYLAMHAELTFATALPPPALTHGNRLKNTGIFLAHLAGDRKPD